MNPVTWLGLAGDALLLGGAGSAAVRVEVLVGAGRLRAADPAPQPRRRGPGARPAVWAAGFAAGAAGVLARGGPLLGLSAAAVIGVAWIVGRDLLRRRADAARRRDLLTAVRLLVSELEAGARPSGALTAAAEASPAYAHVFARAAARATGAGDAASVLLGDRDTRPVGFAWRLGEDAGLELAGVLTSVARDLGSRAEQRRNVAVALAGARASAALIVALPLLGGALGVAMGARPWDFLTGMSAGRAVCFVGTALDAAGALWLRAILRHAEQRDGNSPAALVARLTGRTPVRSLADASLPLVLDLAAAALRSGRPLADALALAAPAGSSEVHEALARVASLAGLGADPAEAWSGIPREGPLGEVALVGIRSAASGARLASALTRLADEIRVDRAAAATARAHRAGVISLAPLAACFLPSFVCLGVVPVVASVASSALSGLS